MNIICKDCQEEFPNDTSMGDIFDLCQSCWEAESSRMYWDEVELLQMVQRTEFLVNIGAMVERVHGTEKAYEVVRKLGSAL